MAEETVPAEMPADPYYREIEMARAARDEMEGNGGEKPTVLPNNNFIQKTGRDSYFMVVWLRDREGQVEGSARFRFSEVERLKRTEFNVHLAAEVSSGGKHKEWSGRINLASNSAREGVVRAFSRMFDGKEFDSCFSDAIVALGKRLDSEAIAKPVWKLEAFPEGNQMLFPRFIKAGSSNLIFGDGGSGKTYLVMGMLYALASGLPFLGFKPARKATSIFLNYEDSERDFQKRFHQVTAGFKGEGMDDAVVGVHHIKAFGTPLCDMVPLLKKAIQETGAEVIAIDSAAYACGAEPESADAVIRMFNALDDLGIASVIIGHIRKSDAEAENKERGQTHAIGSVFFHNAPRNIWNAVSQAPESEHDPLRRVALFHRKNNDGPKHGMTPVEVEFQGGDQDRGVPAHTVVIRPGRVSDWEDSKPLPDRILSFLTRGPTSRTKIDEEFSDVPKNTLKSSLRRLKERGKVRQLGGDNGDYSLK